MRTTAWLALALLLLPHAALAGGTVCVDHNASLALLSKPKLPKTGASSPLHGFLDIDGQPPIHGTLSRGITGTLVAGFTYYLDDGVTCFARLTLDDTLAGSGEAACTDDPDNEFAVTWTPTDC